MLASAVFRVLDWQSGSALLGGVLALVSAGRAQSLTCERGGALLLVGVFEEMRGEGYLLVCVFPNKHRSI